MNFKSCLDCTERHINCHSKCLDYKLYKEYLDRIKKKKEKEQIVPSHSKRRGRGKYYER